MHHDDRVSQCFFFIPVSVPEGVKPGQDILVTAPDGSGRCVRVTVPEGALPGHVFMVKMETAPVIAIGVPLDLANDVPQDLLLTPEPSDDRNEVELTQTHQQVESPNVTVARMPTSTQQQQNQAVHDGRVLVQVPPGVSPGSKIRVKIPDGRTIDVTVPAEEAITQFYVQVPPKKQNWHDNPLAYGAPMVAAPFLM